MFGVSEERVWNGNGSAPSQKWLLCIAALQRGVRRRTRLQCTLADLFFAVPSHLQASLFKNILFSMQFVDFTRATPVHRARGDICLIM